MPSKKFAISIPEDVMAQVDSAAASRGMTRSGFIAEVLRRTASARTDADITRRINRLFADPEMTREQRETARTFGAAASPAGTEW